LVEIHLQALKIQLNLSLKLHGQGVRKYLCHESRLEKILGITQLVLSSRPYVIQYLTRGQWKYGRRFVMCWLLLFYVW